MHLAHPLAVTSCKIIIDGDYVYALAREGVEVGREDSHKGLTFAGLHFGNTALMQNNAADKLHSERLHTQNTPRSLSHGSKSLRENIVQRLAIGKAGLELLRLGPKLGIREL